MDVTAVFIVLIVFGAPLMAAIVIANLVKDYKLKARELEIRKIEAQSRLLTASADLPEWLDKDDPSALAEWQKARAELNRLSAQAAARRNL